MQLDLWSQPQEELPFSWADGDLAQLVRLASLLRSNLEVVRGSDGRLHCLRILSTRISDGKVWATYQEVPSPVRGCFDEDEVA